MIHLALCVCYPIIGLAIGRYTSGWVAWSNAMARTRTESSGTIYRSQQRAPSPPKLVSLDYALGFFTLVLTMGIWPVVVLGYGWGKRGQAIMVTPPNAQQVLDIAERDALKARLKTLGLPSGEDDNDE